MSETDNSPTDEKPQYTVQLNNKEYALNEETRQRIQTRAENEYSENHLFSCFWKVASAENAQDSDIHEVGDPILVIETEGPMVPWSKLDQLEMEMKDTSSFNEFDAGGSDVNEGNGMKTVKPGEVDPNQGGDDSQEMSRTHFSVTPQDFQEVPSPDGERPDRIPAKPESFDEPKMVMWVPENPDIKHSWSAGEAIAPMFNWVEWNVQSKADQPRITTEADDSHDHWESILKANGCEVVAELQPKQQPSEPDTSDSVDDDDVPQHFKDGKYGGNNWSV